MSKGGFSVVIEAQDKASKRLADINKRLSAISAPTQRLNREFGRLAHSTGLRSVGVAIKETSRYAERLAAAAGRFAAPFAALTGGAGLAGIAGLSRQYADFGSNLDIAARRAGMSVTHLMRLRNASYLAGGSMEAANAAAEGLGRSLALGRAGKGSMGFYAGMSALGIDWHHGSADQIMPEVLRKLAAIRNPQQQAYFGESILGSGFSQIQPMLMEGVRGLRQYMAAAQQAGLVTKQQAAAARNLQFQERRLELSVVGLGNSIMADLVPGINSAAGGMAGWLQQNRAWLAADISGDLKAVASGMQSVTTAIGGWRHASGDLLEWWGSSFAPGILKPLLRADAVLRALGQTGHAAGVPGARTEENTARGALWGGAIGSVVPGFGTALGAGIGAGVGALWGLDPFGLNDVTPGQAWRRWRGSTKTQNQRARAAMWYFEQKGYTPAQAAGIVGNFMGESGLNPAASNGSHRGIAQWDAARRNRILKATGIDVWHANYQQQLAAAYWELHHTKLGQGANAAVLGSKTAAGAAVQFRNRFERPGYVPGDEQRRIGYADELLSRYPSPIHIAPRGAPWKAAAAPSGKATPITAHLATRTAGRAAAAPTGKATVHVKFSNPPPGVSTTAMVEGDLFHGAPKVTTSMPPGGVP